MEEKVSYIYKVTNLVNGKIYIGQSVDPIRRIKQHIDVRSKQGYLLNYAVKKYGVENFLFEVIRSEIPIEQINEIEIQCIREHNCKRPYGYNLTNGGEGTKGYAHSQETRKKMSQAQFGKKLSDETKNKLRTFNVGKRLSEEHIHKISTAKIGTQHSEETKKKISLVKQNMSEDTKKKMSESHKGKPSNMSGKSHSEESKRKISIANSNPSEDTRKKMSESAKNRYPISEKTRNKLKAARLGKKHSEESKKKMGQAIKGIRLSDEHRKKLSEAAKNRKFRFIKNKVLQFDLDGILINEYDSINDACNKTGLGYKAINNVLTGWGKTAGNFIWKYKEKTI